MFRLLSTQNTSKVTKETRAREIKNKLPHAHERMNAQHVSSLARQCHVSSSAPSSSSSSFRTTRRRGDALTRNSSGVGQDRFEIALTGQEEEGDKNKSAKKRTISLDLGGNQMQTTSIEYTGELIAVEIERPLGLILEETRMKQSIETQIEVVEIVPDSNAAKDGRVKVGDVLRLTTAVFNVSAPIDVTTWMNPPAKANVRAFVKDSTFDKTMLAIQSHSVPVDYDGDSREMKSVGMIFERK
jgi:hypothetical protein